MTTTAPFMTGNYAPVSDEFTSRQLRVTGTIPDSLDGRLLRIGPNPIDPDDAPHWFTGTGMAHGLRLRDGQAEWFHSRYVRSDRVTAALGWPETPGPRHGMGDNTANTNIIGHAGRTYAIVEAGGLPMELDDELETVTRSDFDGTLDGSFTAHPKRCPDTDELHAITYYWEWDHVRYVVVGTDGRVRRTVHVPVPGKPMIHDCAITESSVLVFDLPVHFDLEAAMNGQALPYRWNLEHGARVGVLPREGEADDIVWYDVDPCWVFHPLNAHDTADGSIVVDVSRHPAMFDTSRNYPDEGPPTLDRWTIDPEAGVLKEERLSDRPIEFPRHDERLVGKSHRFGYGVELDPHFGYGAALKIDVANGIEERRDFGPGRHSQEAVFVPFDDSAAEDEGWLMAYVHDDGSDTADVEIWASQDFAGDPVARIHLDVRVPYGFHGNWVEG